MLYPAHIRKTPFGEREEQTVCVHCRHAAEYASWVAPPDMKSVAFLAGLLHDMGKFTAAFSSYLEKAFANEPVRRGSVNHTFAGVRFVMERWHEPAESIRSVTAELIAYVIGAHHGLFDPLSPEGADGFCHRMEKEDIGYDEAKSNFLMQCTGLSELDTLFEKAVREVAAVFPLCEKGSDSLEESLFALGLLTRGCLSAVLEGDRRDTAEFMAGQSFSLPKDESAADWKRRLEAVETKLDALPSESSINQARRQISDCCRAAACAPGVYRLTVPTGGGKTLTTLRYALSAAAREKKTRLFFVIPLLSVLDQNADVLREFLGDSCPILEHHSNVVREKPPCGELDENELLMESWRAPVVITTLVQLLNTLFAGTPSCVRRMTALYNSVIVLDEVQSVPRRMLSLFNLAVNFLTSICSATVVLCSATQPCLEHVEHPLRYAPSPELVPHNAALWEVFRRTEILDKRLPQGYTPPELASFALSCAKDSGSLLVIANTKAEARTLFAAIGESSEKAVFHLSTAMCMAHRLDTLNLLRRLLDERTPVLCVSTQLVEAGVDFSFGCVIRLLAGMDNIVQAAGRCNRGGEFGGLCPVYILNLRGEDLRHLPEIRQSQEAAASLLLQFARDSDAFEHDLTGKKAIDTFYRTLFADMKRESTSFPLKQTTLFRLLSDNPCRNAPAYYIRQAFATAGEAFHVFESNTHDVLVPYEKGAELIADLSSDRAKYDLAFRGSCLREAGQYSVSLYEYEWEKLQDSGALYDLCDNAVTALRPEFYREDIGLCIENPKSDFLGV